MPAMNFLTRTIRNASRRFFFLLITAQILMNGVLQVPNASEKLEGAHQPQYLWPTNASRTISSSFAETRDGHFHFGIDIRTNMGLGYPCYAVGDGDVVRVRVSPYGYGRALYLQLKDGRTAVYAHLQRFEPRVEEIIKARQYQQKNYRCEIFLEPGRVSFKRGDVVAYTGSSGVGLPHLHFEIRDARGYCNPNQFGFTVEDTHPPIAEKIALFPLNVESEIDSVFEPKIYPLKQEIGGTEAEYALGHVPSVFGPIGLGISGYDLTDGARNEISFYGMDLFIDDSLCFSARYDDFGFEEAKQIELERDFRLQRHKAGIFHHLWWNENVTADFYRAGSGVLNRRTLSPGLHDFEIVLTDFAGNATYVTGQLRLLEEPFYPEVPEFSRLASFFGSRIEPVTSQNSSSMNCNIQADFFDDYVVLSLPNQSSATDVQFFLLHPYRSSIPVINYHGKWIGKLPLMSFPPGPLTVEVQLHNQDGKAYADTAEWIMQSIPASGGSAFSQDGRFRAIFEPGSLYRTLFARVTAKSAPSQTYFRSPIYRLDPYDVPIRGNVELSITIPPNESQPERLGIYKFSKKGKWVFIDNDHKTPGAICGSAPALESYVLILDDDPPQLSWLSPNLTTSDRRPKFSLKVTDELSGVDDRSVTLEIDGRWMLMEYDPEADRIVGRPEEPLSRSQHQISVSVKDFCGNETQIRRTLTIINP